MKVNTKLAPLAACLAAHVYYNYGRIALQKHQSVQNGLRTVSGERMPQTGAALYLIASGMSVSTMARGVARILMPGSLVTIAGMRS